MNACDKISEELLRKRWNIYIYGYKSESEWNIEGHIYSFVLSISTNNEISVALGGKIQVQL